MLHFFSSLQGLTIASSLSLAFSLQLITCRDTVAQVTPDGTLSTTVTSADALSFTIENGTRSGKNLFHSFSDFSVPTNGSAVFNNAVDITNILSRVTGSNVSSIDGLIQANGTANLFLLNPNGLVFGPNASLNIGGSFVGSTANTLLFEDGLSFSTDTRTTPLLSVNVPTGLQWNQSVSNPITVTNATLEVPTGKTLALLGGDLSLSDSTLNAPAGQVMLGGLATAGTISLDSDQTPNFPEEVARGDVILDGTGVDVRSGGNGHITVNSNTLTLSNSELQAGLGENLGNADAVAGDITIHATGDLGLDNRSLIANDVATGALGQGGNIDLTTTGSLDVTGGSRIQAVTNSGGRSGDITINASGNIRVAGFASDGQFSGILSQTATETSGRGGNITINTPGRLRLANRGFIASVTDSQQRGGRIELNVGQLALRSGGQIVTITTNTGRAGTIVINATERVSLRGESDAFVPNPFLELAVFDLDELTFTTDSDPNIAESDTIPHVTVKRTPTQIVSGSTVLGSAEAQVDYYSFSVTEGNSRAILDIDFGFIKEDPVTSVDTVIILFNRSTGEFLEFSDASNPTAGATGSSGLSRSFSLDAFLDVQLEDPGTYLLGVAAFPVSFSSNELIGGATPEVGNTYTLQVSLENQGTEGVSLPEPLDLMGVNPTLDSVSSSIFTNASGLGPGGDLRIHTPRLMLDEFTLIASETIDSPGGDIVLNVENRLFNNFGDIILGTYGRGKGGNFTLHTQNLVQKGGIFTETSSRGNSGDILVSASESVVLSSFIPDFPTVLSSDIGAEAEGNGGDITVETPLLRLLNGGQIATSTTSPAPEGGVNRNLGNPGNLTIIANTIDLIGATSDGDFPSGVFAQTVNGGAGGTIIVDTERLLIANGAAISAGTSSAGQGGDIIITADESIDVIGFGTLTPSRIRSDSSHLFGTAPEDATGNAGNIAIKTKHLRVIDGGQIDTRTDGLGNAGTVTIDATDVEIHGAVPGRAEQPVARSALSVEVSDFADESGLDNDGRGGRLTLEAERLRITEGGEIFSSTAGGGPAGDIFLTVDQLEVTGQSNIGPSFSRIEAASESDASAGDINILANQVRVSDGGFISVSGPTQDTVGTLTLDADRLLLDRDGSFMSTVEGNASDAGSDRRPGPQPSVEQVVRNMNESVENDRINIDLNIDDLLVLRRGSFITANALQGESGANIEIDAPIIATVPGENSDIIADAELEGTGGNITLRTQSIIGMVETDIDNPRENSINDINASSDLGIDGNVVVVNPDPDPASDTVELPSGLSDESDRISTGCFIALDNSFTVIGRGGLPDNPTTVGNAPIWEDWRSLETAVDPEISESSTAETLPRSQAVLIEATEMMVHANGQVEFVASTASMGGMMQQRERSCERETS